MALLAMPKQNQSTAEQGGYVSNYGWTHAEDFTTVHVLLRAFELAPYDPSKQISLRQLLREYGTSIGLVLALLVVMMLATAYVGRANRKLALSQAELARHRDNLEQKVTKRTHELSKVNLALEQDILAREKVAATLRRSRTALQGFYEISVAAGDS